jgi:adenylate kinase
LNILLFGAPGAGKGTQSSFLTKNLNYTQISTGDLFRSAIKNNTDLGKLAKSFMDKGGLVPDEVTVSLVERELASLNGKKFILDGFPRNVNQAESLWKSLNQLGLKISKAFFINVEDAELVSRLSGRRTCKGCGAVYHLIHKPSAKEGICDLCGNEVVQRSDDKSDVVLMRLKTYQDQTAPLKDYFASKGILIEVDGNHSPEGIYGFLAKELKGM